MLPARNWLDQARLAGLLSVGAEMTTARAARGAGSSGLEGGAAASTRAALYPGEEASRRRPVTPGPAGPYGLQPRHSLAPLQHSLLRLTSVWCVCVDWRPAPAVYWCCLASGSGYRPCEPLRKVHPSFCDRCLVSDTVPGPSSNVTSMPGDWTFSIPEHSGPSSSGSARPWVLHVLNSWRIRNLGP